MTTARSHICCADAGHWAKCQGQSLRGLTSRVHGRKVLPSERSAARLDHHSKPDYHRKVIIRKKAGGSMRKAYAWLIVAVVMCGLPSTQAAAQNSKAKGQTKSDKAMS